MAHVHDLGNGLHRQTIAVGRADGFVALLPQRFAGFLQGLLAPGVVLGKGGQTASNFGGLAFRAGDSRIV